jgi:hypothetical protein
MECLRGWLSSNHTQPDCARTTGIYYPSLPMDRNRVINGTSTVSDLAARLLMNI